jgi:uncharacterized protein YbjT (DUF2867 family)
MKIVIIGGSGRIGQKLAALLQPGGHTVVSASPSSGVDTLTGQGLPQALQGADVVVDVTNSPSFADDAVLRFFQTSTRNLLAAGAEAGVRHHVALSVVGAERAPDSGYLRAKLAQEALIQSGKAPYTIVRATQFYEFLATIAQAGTQGNTVRMPSALIQPIAADDVATTLADVVTAKPLNAICEVGGPQSYRMDDLIARVLRDSGDPRKVVTDPQAGYFGAQLGERTLVTGPRARTGATTLEQWQARAAAR